MPSPVNIGALLTAGLRAEYGQAFTPRYQGVMDRIGTVIGEVTSDKLTELYGALKAPIYPIRWDNGTEMPSKDVLSVQISVTNLDWGRRVYLPRNWEDDQTKTAWQVARGLGQNWATLPERLFYQFITAGTDADLMPVVTASYDGTALYSASAREGASSGNIVTQTGSTTVQQIITDFYSMDTRFADMQNSESQPFWDPADLNHFTLFYGTSINLVMAQAAKQMTVMNKIAGTSTTDISTAAGVNNMILASGKTVTFQMSQRISNSAIYSFLTGIPNEQRAVARQLRKGLNEAVGNWETSDHTRSTGQPYVQYDNRETVFSFLFQSTVKIV
jgi:hypothetical protein